MIEAVGLTKRYGEVAAVDDLSFTVRPGEVTGFLGANGAGKSTTLRVLVGLDAPTSGRITVCGKGYAELRDPARTVGALLDARLHPRRSARDHLRWMAAAAGLPASRVAEVLALVDMTRAADRRGSALSLGMRQRVGLAGALLGDPAVLVLDEPLNGLDPAGIRWMRDLLRDLAAEGRTVFLSSHQMAEVEQTAERVVVVAAGRLVAEVDVRELRGRGAAVRVVPVEAAEVGVLAAAVVRGGGEVASAAPLSAGDAPGARGPRGDGVGSLEYPLCTARADAGDGGGATARPEAGSAKVGVASPGDPPPGPGLTVCGLAPAEVGRIALAAGIALQELGVQGQRLEESFLALTGGAATGSTHTGSAPTGGAR